jgi:hypothetical protein
VAGSPGLFGFRRKDKGARRSADAPTEAPAVPAAVAAADPTPSSAPAAIIDLDAAAAPAGSAGAPNDEHSDPSRAATEGMWEVIRPAAIVPEHAARRVLVELARRDLTNGGEWQSEPQLWSRYDGPLRGDGSGAPELMGTIHVTYGTPTKYEITLYRVTVTAGGVAAGWTVASLCDEALGFGGLTLAECPRATVNTPPRPYTY